MSDSAGSQSLPQQYFDEIYAAHADPWGFATSSYEAEKYAASLAALSRERYGTALEVGCSIGVFTAMLAGRCDNLLAVDVAEKALSAARMRCEDQRQVRFELRSLPDQFPEGNFDLITVCEVAYYWSAEDLLKACRVMAQHQPEGAELLLVHWTPSAHDYPQVGDAVHDTWLQQPWWHTRISQRHPLYRLDALQRNTVVL